MRTGGCRTHNAGMAASRHERPKDRRHYLRTELYGRVASDPRFFDFLQECAFDGLWYQDLDDPQALWISPRFWRLLGYRPSEKPHAASEWQALMFPEDLALCEENQRRHLANPAWPFDQIVRFRHRLGHTVWTRCRGVALRNAQGTPNRMLVTLTDLSSLIGSQEMVAALKMQVEALKMQVETLQMQKQILRERLADAGLDCEPD